MTIHREGYRSIAIGFIVLVALNLISCYLICSVSSVACWIVFFLTLFLFLFLVSFFRIPNRKLTIHEGKVIAPADGKVVVIEETVDEEYFNEKRLQVSIFMSPANVHVNRNPISGEVVYNQYHKGKYLVAWHPKSSTENERHTVVYEKNGREILVKQIAGALARRIVNYLQPGQQVRQTEEMGFIKFGSRVDLLLPLDAVIKVKIGDRPLGGVTEIATW